ncbi:MAG: HAMP domain-containing histidine kinase [Marinosulfonomonas sp.]|nr:HAMP domain-containing histidine kinase [Marinosulfonomonas sp.]
MNNPRAIFMRFSTSLRMQISVVLTLTLAVGGVAAGGWYKWDAKWERYMVAAFQSGISLFEVVEQYLNTPGMGVPSHDAGFDLSVVVPQQVTSADNSVKLRFSNLDGRTFETRFSFLDFRNPDVFEGNRIPIRVFSRKLTYSLGVIPGAENAGLSARFGYLVRTLTNYCGDTLMFVNIGEGRWLRIGGPKIWGCESAPKDWRLLILIFAGVSFGTFLTIGMSAVDRLDNLSNEIESRAKSGRITPIKQSNPKEILAISAAVNDYFDREKDRLEHRANLLSGISHDLGTPATRLKLRAALIDDPALRTKFEGDIDQITNMIESVLAYTRNEMNIEEQRRVSIHSLVQSVVDDYADIGLPVTLAPMEAETVDSTGTIFKSGSKRSKVNLSDQKRLLCFCRPNAIRRALCNLIDNAIKYGKSAHVTLSATSECIRVLVQDAGGSNVDFDFENMVEPFKRGDNAAHRKGIGLGLTIVSNIALSHGGKLAFESRTEGICATLTLPR